MHDTRIYIHRYVPHGHLQKQHHLNTTNVTRVVQHVNNNFCNVNKHWLEQELILCPATGHIGAVDRCSTATAIVSHLHSHCLHHCDTRSLPKSVSCSLRCLYAALLQGIQFLLLLYGFSHSLSTLHLLVAVLLQRALYDEEARDTARHPDEPDGESRYVLVI